MNHNRPFFAGLIFPALLICLSSCNPGTEQTGGEGTGTGSPAAAPSTQTNRTYAAEGDSVWVIVNHVKADKRQQFEQFVHEVFWPSAQRLSPEDQRSFRQTRILHPAGPEADGTYSYIFIMDPLIEGADYDIQGFLGKMYPKEKAEEYSRMFVETMARNQTHYRTVQARSHL